MGLSGLCYGQEINLTGSFQQALVSGRLGQQLKSGERFNRSLVNAESGNWAAKASFWNYVFCKWNELDETTLSYSDPKFRARIGRFILPVGQSNWDDQWYSNFVFIPMVESQRYGDHKFLQRTSTGADIDFGSGANSFRLALTSSRAQVNQLMPDKIDRASLRWNHSLKNTIFGLSTYTDTNFKGDEEQMHIADIRWTVPHWIVRGEGLHYQSAVQKFSGYFLDISHRPANWEDVTFALRFERMSSLRGTRSDIRSWALAAKTRLPWDMTLLVNYMGGPDMNRIGIGGGWAFGLNKTFQF
jgi:hypothetical protein